MFLVTYKRRKPSRNRNSGVKGASVQKEPVVFLYRCSLNLLRGSHWHHLWCHFFHDLANMQKGTLNIGLQVCGVHTERTTVQYYTSFGGSAVTETEEQEVNEFESWSENISVRKSSRKVCMWMLKETIIAGLYREGGGGRSVVTAMQNVCVRHCLIW